MNQIEDKHNLVSAEVRRLRVRKLYTIELYSRLDDLTAAFSQMARPDADRFMRQPTFNRDGLVEPVSDSTKAAFSILNGGDGYGRAIAASNVAMIENLFIYCKPDVILWIIPLALKAIQDRWNDVVEKSNFITASHEPIDDIPLLLYWSEWYASELQPVAQVMDAIADIFCDTLYTDQTGVSAERRKKKSAKIKQYMTPDMRRTLKAYLVSWYGEFGRKKAIVVDGQRLPKIWAHNFRI